MLQDTNASEDKLQMCVPMMDKISFRTLATTHMKGFDSVQDTDTSEAECDLL